MLIQRLRTPRTTFSTPFPPHTARASRSHSLPIGSSGRAEGLLGRGAGGAVAARAAASEIAVGALAHPSSLPPPARLVAEAQPGGVEAPAEAAPPPAVETWGGPPSPSPPSAPPSPSNPKPGPDKVEMCDVEPWFLEKHADLPPKEVTGLRVGELLLNTI